MGKYRIHGNNKNSNNNSSNNFNQSNNNNRKCKICNRNGHVAWDCKTQCANTKNCGMKGHSGKNCTKPGGGAHKKNLNTNNENYQSQHNKKVKNRNDYNSSNRQTHHPKEPCTRCGFRNHDVNVCNAKALPSDEWCNCGNEYHRANQCPWNHDCSARKHAKLKATSKICHWCKHKSDGGHTLAECTEITRFRKTALDKIRAAYSSTQWCFHCRSAEHLTIGCDSELRKPNLIKWEARINTVVEQWLDLETSSQLDDVSDDEGEDVHMSVPDPLDSYDPPEPQNWCIYCNEFGHKRGYGCPPAKVEAFRARAPARFKYASVAEREVFGAPAVNDISHTVAVAKAKTPMAQCYKCSCTIMFRPSGQPENCSSCGELNFSPQFWSSKSFGTHMVMAEMLRQNQENLNIALDIAGVRRGPNKRKYDEQWEQQQLGKSRKRPSDTIKNMLFYRSIPEKKPEIGDYNRRRSSTMDGALLMPVIDELGEHQNKIRFDTKGNHQTYFPAIRVQLTPEQLREQNDPRLSINMISAQGFEPECGNCGKKGMVFDDEGDVVMCGTEWANTAGCGAGRDSWMDVSNPTKCACLTVIGQQPRPRWTRP